MNLLNLVKALGRIADSLERIAYAQEILAFRGHSGNSLFSLKGDGGDDGSSVSYVSDEQEWQEDNLREDYRKKTGKVLNREDALPSPDPSKW